MNKLTIILFLALTTWQCQPEKKQPSYQFTTNQSLQPGKKYKVTIVGEMTVEEIGGATDTVPTPPIDTTTHAGSTFFLGCNSNHYQDKAKQTAFNGIRLYLPIGWAWTEKGFYGQPLLQAQKQFLGIDDYLKYMKDKGVDVLLCLMQSPDYLNGHTAGWVVNDWPPIRPGLDKSKPESWKEIAEIYRAFAIRYGSKTWPKGSYKIDPSGPRWTGDSLQVEKSGLNLVKWIEAGNEFDIWWDMSKYLQPEEHAAFLMAVYDAIKSADPNMKVSMAGLTNLDIVYLQRMKVWFSAHNRPFLSDCIAVHRYSNQGDLPDRQPPTWLTNQAVSVEQDPGISDFAKVMAFAKSVNLPVFVGEFGYDSQAGTQMSPTPQSGKTGEQIQSEWLPRAALEYTRMGAERVYLFTMADEPNPNAGLFTSCGVCFGESTGYKVKPAYTAVTNLISILKGMRFTKDESTAQARIMRFEGGSKTTWAYWSPTSDSRTFQATINGQSVTVTESPKYLPASK